MINKIFTVLASLVLVSSAIAQQPACATTQPPTCIPLTYTPVNGPVSVVYAPAKFNSPTKVPSIFKAPNTFEVGVSGGYKDPDYGRSYDLSVGAFTAYDFTRAHLGLEASASQTPVANGGIRESEYLGGVRLFESFGKFKIIGKGLIGETHFNGERGTHRNRGNYFSYGAGGGLEYAVTRHFVVGLDAQYVISPNFDKRGLTPFGETGRVAYRF